MAKSTGPQARDIAQRARELKDLHLGMMFSLPSMLDPTLPILRTELERGRGTGPCISDMPVLVRDAPDGPPLEYSARDIMIRMARLRGDIVGRDLMSISMILGGTRIGDMIVQTQLSSSGVPLLQFARHFRNACAHGDRWCFTRGEPKFTAACRALILDAAMHGSRATWEMVTPRLYLEFLEDIAAYFDTAA